ncbi:hypothetical protein [Streptomyces laurentii]|uniref:hypothetical protein n=1 Tax=Streptomyces laurentii TaxID=39478 RepID=UPI003F4D353A
MLRAPGVGQAVVRIAAAMTVNAGFLFTLTLHPQGGLGQSALRTGLTFGPTAVVFGLVGLTWRRWPARPHPFLVPGGFLLAAVSALAVGAVPKGGGTGGWLLYPAFCGMGAGLALAFNPALTSALATVRPADAADASGPLATVTQLGQLIGVATVGPLFLGRITGPGADVSARVLWVCAFALALTALVGACAGRPSDGADPLAGPWQNRTAGGECGSGREGARMAVAGAEGVETDSDTEADTCSVVAFGPGPGSASRGPYAGRAALTGAA